MGSQRSAISPYLSFSLVLLAVTITLFLATAEGRASGGHHHQRHLRHHSKSHPKLAARNPIVRFICQKTSYPAVCISTSKPLKKSLINLKAVTTASIRASIQKVTKARGYADKLVKSQSGVRRQILRVCKENYSYALSDLSWSLKNLQTRPKADIKNRLSAALTYISTCDDGYAETPGVTSPLAKQNLLLRKIASNNLALVGYLRKH